MYKFLKLYCNVALHFFYNKWQVHQLRPVPSGAVIFVANHQNAFLDAILVSCSTTRNPWFIARAGVFKRKSIGYLLRLLKMLPIYRFRDGFETLKSNEAVFANYVDLLKKGEAILIFAEGNHDERWHLRTFQKGFAKLAISAAQSTPIKIVPVGLQYDAHSVSGSQVLITFGDPIEVFKVDQNENLKIAYSELIKQVHDSVKGLMLHLDVEKYEQQLNYLKINRVHKPNLAEQLKCDQKTISEFPEGYSPFSAIRINSIRSVHPLFFYNYINHFVARFIIQSILTHFVKDKQFIGSIKFAVGMFLVPLCYVFQTAILFLFTHSIIASIVYFISLPLSFKYFTKTKY